MAVTYTLRSQYAATYGGGVINVSPGRDINVGQALTAGGGYISVLDTDAPLLTALDGYLPLQRVTYTASPLVKSTRQLAVEAGSPSNAEIVVRRPDGVLEAVTDDRWLAIGFGGDPDGSNVEGEQLWLSTSGDADSFAPMGRPIATAGRSRDQDILYAYGRYFLAYTKAPAFGVVSTGFGLKVSDDLQTWTSLSDVDFAAAVPTVKRVWGPWWLQDVDQPRVLVAITTTNSDLGPFVMYETHPTNATMTTWSAPVPLTGTLPTSVFDFGAVRVGTGWVALYKDNNTEWICRATASDILGPWTPTHTGDWMGAGASLGVSPPHMEGPHVEKLPNGNWRCWWDRYLMPGFSDFRNATEYYQDTATADLSGGWTAPQIAKVMPRHVRVRKMPLPRGFTEAQTVPHLEVARVATYAAPSGFTTPIPWDFVDEDPDGMIDLSASATSATVRSGGLWTVSVNVVWLTATTGNVFAGIRFNEDFQPGVTEKRAAANLDPAISIAVTRRLRRGDRIDVCIQSDAARNLGTVPQPRMRATRVGS
jgi:hypothetical protein